MAEPFPESETPLFPEPEAAPGVPGPEAVAGLPEPEAEAGNPNYSAEGIFQVIVQICFICGILIINAIILTTIASTPLLRHAMNYFLMSLCVANICVAAFVGTIPIMVNLGREIPLVLLHMCEYSRETSDISRVLSSVFIAIERYRRIIKKKREPFVKPKIAITGLWVTALLLASEKIIVMDMIDKPVPHFGVKEPMLNVYQGFIILNLLVVAVFPMFVLGFSHVSVIRHLFREMHVKAKGQEEENGDQEPSAASDKNDQDEKSQTNVPSDAILPKPSAEDRASPGDVKLLEKCQSNNASPSVDFMENSHLLSEPLNEIHVESSFSKGSETSKRMRGARESLHATEATQTGCPITYNRLHPNGCRQFLDVTIEENGHDTNIKLAIRCETHGVSTDDGKHKRLDVVIVSDDSVCSVDDQDVCERHQVEEQTTVGEKEEILNSALARNDDEDSNKERVVIKRGSFSQARRSLRRLSVESIQKLNSIFNFTLDAILPKIRKDYRQRVLIILMLSCMYLMFLTTKLPSFYIEIYTYYGPGYFPEQGRLRKINLILATFSSFMDGVFITAMNKQLRVAAIALLKKQRLHLHNLHMPNLHDIFHPHWHLHH